MPEHAVVLLVGRLDRRVVPALRFINSLGDVDARAVHIAFDAEKSRALAEAWMDLGATWLPLHICDPADLRMAAAARAAVAEVAAGADQVTVVLPELALSRWWHRLLHRRTARRIAHELYDLPGVTTVVVPARPRMLRRPTPARRA